jgi:alpha-L-rhamnosidase
MNSQNHILPGSVDAWFYRFLAGLSPALPGWKKIRVRPHVLGDLTFVEASLETVAGRIGSAWKRAGDVFSLDVRVPVGSTGEVRVPLLGPGARVLESGKSLWRAGHAVDPVPGIVLAGDDGRSVVFEIGSGTYSFESRPGG